MMGVDKQDINRSLRKVEISIPIRSIIKFMLPLMKKVALQADTAQIVTALGIDLRSITAKTARNSSLDASVALGFLNAFKFEVSGLNYFAVDLGVDSFPFVSLNCPSIESRSNGDLSVTAQLKFPSSDGIKNSLSRMLLDMTTGKLGTSTTKINIKGIQLGRSPKESLKLLSGLKLDLPAKLLMDQNLITVLLPIVFKSLGMSSDESMLKMAMERIGIPMLNLDAGQPDMILFGTTLGIAKTPLIADINIGYASLQATMDSSS